LFFAVCLTISSCATIGKSLKPSDEELDASRRNCRWTYALQHDYLAPGSAYAEQVMRGAEIERQSGRCGN